MDRPFVEASRRSRGACVALGLATALTLGFSASAGADDIACHGTEKTATAATTSPTPEEVARLLATVRVENAPAICPAIDDPGSLPAMRAFVDPETGLLRKPTAEDWAALRSAEASRFERRAVRGAAASSTLTLPRGGVAEVAGPDALTEISLQVGSDGTRTLSCSQSGHAPATPAKSPEKAKE